MSETKDNPIPVYPPTAIDLQVMLQEECNAQAENACDELLSGIWRVVEAKMFNSLRQWEYLDFEKQFTKALASSEAAKLIHAELLRRINDQMFCDLQEFVEARNKAREKNGKQK